MIDRRERIEIATIEECKVPFRAKKKRWRNAIKEFLASRPASPRVHWLVVFFLFFFSTEMFRHRWKCRTASVSDVGNWTTDICGLHFSRDVSRSLGASRTRFPFRKKNIRTDVVSDQSDVVKGFLKNERQRNLSSILATKIYQD